jgi:hypothetical protein
MQEPVSLILNGAYNIRVPVAGVTNTDASNGIQVFFPGNIVQVYSLCPNDLKTQRSGGRLANVFKK